MQPNLSFHFSRVDSYLLLQTAAPIASQNHPLVTTDLWQQFSCQTVSKLKLFYRRNFIPSFLFECELGQVSGRGDNSELIREGGQSEKQQKSKEPLHPGMESGS